MDEKTFTGYRLFMASIDTIAVGHFNLYPLDDDLFVTDDVFETEREAEEALIVLKEQLDIPLTTREKVLRLKIRQRRKKEFVIRELDSMIDHFQKSGLTSTEIEEYIGQMRTPVSFLDVPSLDYMDYVQKKLFGEKKKVEESINI